MSEANFDKGEETLASLSYGCDNEGQLASTASRGLPGEESTAYSYGSAERLTKDGETAYEYDAAGNPKKLGSSTAGYDEASQFEHAHGPHYDYRAEDGTE